MYLSTVNWSYASKTNTRYQAMRVADTVHSKLTYLCTRTGTDGVFLHHSPQKEFGRKLAAYFGTEESVELKELN